MRSESSASTGSLWRDTVNFLGDDRITPSVFVPLLEHVASRPASDGYFLDRMGDHLRKLEDRAEVQEEVTFAAIGYRIWTECRDTLHAWANKTQDGPITEDDLGTWWILDKDQHGIVADEAERWRELLEAVGLTEAEQQVVDDFLVQSERFGAIITRRMRCQLKWLHQLNWLRELAKKTWPADIRDRESWTSDDLFFVDEYFSDQQPELFAPDDDGNEVNPFALRPAYSEQNLGLGLDGLEYCMYVLMRSSVIDFMNDILESSSFPSLRGSMRCIECGRYVERRPRGHGQLYCHDRCKKRAAKRRNRSHAKARLAAVKA